MTDEVVRGFDKGQYSLTSIEAGLQTQHRLLTSAYDGKDHCRKSN